MATHNTDGLNINSKACNTTLPLKKDALFLNYKLSTIWRIKIIGFRLVCEFSLFLYLQNLMAARRQLMYNNCKKKEENRKCYIELGDTNMLLEPFCKTKVSLRYCNFLLQIKESIAESIQNRKWSSIGYTLRSRRASHAKHWAGTLRGNETQLQSSFEVEEAKDHQH